MRTVYFLSVLLMVGIAWAQDFANILYNPAPVEAKVAPYTVAADLGNVSNASILPKLTDAQMKALVSNASVAMPTADEQLFYIYENDTYAKIPTFVTTDSVLHTYHVFYDYTLRYLEEKYLFKVVHDLSRRMLDTNLAALNDAHTEDTTEVLHRNAAFFAVPLVLLGEKPALPDEVQVIVDDQIGLIMDHDQWAVSLSGARVDFSQFIPRGHYTRTEAFQQYFLAMVWYGLVPMKLTFDARNQRPVIETLVTIEQLSQDATARDLWQQLYDPTVFYVGKADDLSYTQLAPLATKVFGTGALDRFDDAAKDEQFCNMVAKDLPPPKIQTYDAFDGGLQGLQFRFMGQRFIPDSRMLQELTWPKVGTTDNERGMPMGLDVFAVLGSARAADLLDNTYQQTAYAHYLDQRKMLQGEVNALTPEEWWQNLYYGWMYCLQPMLTPAPEGYPSFMRAPAWVDKSLVTALGSWAELRHDTILYAKQSSVAECGDAPGTLPPPRPAYVEPQVALYERLSYLLKLNKAGLVARKFSTGNDELSRSFDQFTELMDFLALVSRKELRNETPSTDDLRALETYGGTLEWLMLSASNLSGVYTRDWWELKSKTDRDMALVADVHTYSPNGGVGQVLEEGAGHAAEIWVVVPFDGKLVLTRGATFTYYEFEQPADDRLTDEKWQGMLSEGQTPALPEWMNSYMVPGTPPAATPHEHMQGAHTGC